MSQEIQAESSSARTGRQMAEPADRREEYDGCGLYSCWSRDRKELKDFYEEVGGTMAESTRAGLEEGGSSTSPWGESAEVLSHVPITLPTGERVTVQICVRRPVMCAWSLALHDENCLMLSQLVKENPELVLVNIDEDSKKFAITNRTNTSWKQRTALHAGARRGSVLLVVQLINVFQEANRWMPWWTTWRRECRGCPINDVLQIFLKELLLKKDEEYELDALAMAVVNGNREVIRVLTKCSVNSAKDPYKIGRHTAAHDYRGEPEPLRKNLQQITQSALEEYKLQKKFKESYRKSLDFNFLPGLLYTFHFTFSSSVQELTADELNMLRKGIFQRARVQARSLGANEVSPLNALCDLQDGQGRTAMHVATDQKTLHKFLDLITSNLSVGEQYPLLESLDGKGRTPIYRAAITNNSSSIKVLLEHDMTNRKSDAPIGPRRHAYDTWTSQMKEMGVDLHELSSRNGFESLGGLTMVSKYDDLKVLLSTAVVFNSKQCVELLLEDKRYMSLHVEQKPGDFMLENNRSEWQLCGSALQVAALVGDVSTVKELLKNDKCRNMDIKNERSSKELSSIILATAGRLYGIMKNLPSKTLSSSRSAAAGRRHDNKQRPSKKFPSIHLAAASGRYDILTLLLGEEKYNHFIKDMEGNTPLHHALKLKLSTEINLLDKYNNLHHIQRSGERMKQKMETKEIVYAEKRACVELLLQFGFNVSKVNYQGEVPSPEPNDPHDFLTWWYKRRTQQMIASQQKLNAAANAITITAILIATASYNSLNSPLDPDEYQLSIAIGYYSIQSAAFYFAVSSVVLALAMALPSPQGSVADELEGLKRQVIVAVVLLFPSITCLLVIFAIRVASILTTAHKHHVFPVYISWVVGGLFCLGMLVFLVARLLRVVFYENTIIKLMYKKIPFIS